MEKASIPANKKIVIFLPISVPGSGKSFLMGHFKSQLKEKHNADLQVISSDVLRKQLMDELASKEPSLTTEELFSKTSKRSPHFFNEELAKILKKIAKEDQEISFLFIDKNNLPNAIPRILETLEDRCSSLFDKWRFVGLYPESFQPHQVSNKLFYPFSINFMMNCVQRVQDRKGSHETLNGQGYKSANVLFSFINGYQNEDLNDNLIKKKFRMHLGVKMPMSLENKETNDQFDNEIIEIFNGIIKEDNPRFDSEKNREKVQKFLDVFEAKKYVFPQVSLENIKIFLDSLIDTCFNLFKSEKESDKEFAKKKPQNQEETKEFQNIQKMPAKLPLYLGIFANEEEKAKTLISDYITSNLEWYLARHPEEKSFEKDLKSLKSNFRFPNSIHVTSLFIACNKNKTNTPNFQEFKEGKPLAIEIEAIVYVPYKIICGICFYDNNQILIENEYPHLTMMISGYQAKHSSNVLEALFKFHQSPLKGKYSQDFLRKQESIENCFTDVKINTEKGSDYQKIYVLRQKEILTIEATTAFGYK